MRERRSLEKTQLPESDYEVWIHAQTAIREGRKHRNPAQDLYEAWVKKRVSANLEKTHHRRKGEHYRKKHELPHVNWVQWN